MKTRPKDSEWGGAPGTQETRKGQRRVMALLLGTADLPGSLHS